MNDISHEAQTFADRLQALLTNTWEAVGPHGWALALAILAGAVVGILLVWFLAKIVIALAYSIVGTATIFLGVQAALLAAGVPVVSDLASRRGSLPVAFLVMTVVGWLWQLFYAGPKKPGASTGQRSRTIGLKCRAGPEPRRHPDKGASKRQVPRLGRVPKCEIPHLGTRTPCREGEGTQRAANSVRPPLLKWRPISTEGRGGADTPSRPAPTLASSKAPGAGTVTGPAPS